MTHGLEGRRFWVIDRPTASTGGEIVEHPLSLGVISITLEIARTICDELLTDKNEST